MSDKAPRVLYKYRTAQQAYEMLSNLQMIWRSPVAFNDPYDCNLSYHLPFQRDEFHEGLAKKLLAGAYATIARLDLSPKDTRMLESIKSLTEKFPENERLAKVMDHIKEFIPDYLRKLEGLKSDWKTHLPNFRIFSTSADWSSPTMWAHYAESYSGIVVGFDSSRLAARVEHAEVLGVDYQAEMPGFGTLDFWLDRLLGARAENNVRDLFKKRVFTKSLHWKYENEWRYFADLGTSNKTKDLISIHPINPSHILEIYIGMSTSSENRARIKQIASQQCPHAEIYDLAINEVQFKLEKRPLAISKEEEGLKK